MRQPLILLTLVGLMSTALYAQEPPAPGSPPEKDDKGPAPVEVDDKQARELLKELEAKLRSKEARIRAEGLAPLRGVRHEDFVKPVAKLLKDREKSIVIEAIAVLGNQPYEQTSQTLLRTLKHREHAEDPEVMVPVLSSLGRVGWDRKGYETLRDYFDDVEKREMKRAVFLALAAQKEKRAFSLFVDNLEAPSPASPHAASNPPASYWKARYAEWTYYRHQVATGLKALTGQDFKTRDAAIAWAEEMGKKLGFVYDRGS
jgi:HEAT repeat protein